MNDDTRSAALICGVVALAGPRRSRPLAAFLYGVALSRAHGAARDRIVRKLADDVGELVGRLFSEKTSVGARVDRIEEILRSQYSDTPLDTVLSRIRAEALTGVGGGAPRTKP